MSRDSPQDLASLWGSAHVAQHTTLTIATPQPPAAAIASHDVYCANSPPSFAVSSAIRCAGSSMHVGALSQIHQHILECTLSDGPPLRSSFCRLEQTLAASSREAFVSNATAPSKSQEEVSRALRDGVGLRVEDEYRCSESGYSIDMLVQGTSPAASSAETSGGMQRWAVEFDGPSHFLARGSPNGATLLKRRHLQQLGYTLVVVPYWEWDRVQGREASEVQYLRGKLN